MVNNCPPDVGRIIFSKHIFSKKWAKTRQNFFLTPNAQFSSYIGSKYILWGRSWPSFRNFGGAARIWQPFSWKITFLHFVITGGGISKKFRRHRLLRKISDRSCTPIYFLAIFYSFDDFITKKGILWLKIDKNTL